MSNEKKGKALVILSGGQDSTTCLFWAKQEFDEVHAITFNYGQRHVIELHAAKKVAEMAGVKTHELVEVKGILKSTSPLTSDTELEKYESYDQMDQVIGNRVELTFVPMRNTLFFTVAMNHAVALGCDHLVTGICQEDNANYPDCTEVYRLAYQTMANLSLGTLNGGEARFKIHAPLMNLSKAETVRLSSVLPGCWDALAYSHTSYDGKYPPTDPNHSNVLRAHGFEEADLPDPLVLRAWREGLMELPTTSNYDNVRSPEAQ
jgi:7-cyano-7-deazaguanine synthase